MTKLEFLTRLRESLSGLPEEDVESSIDYYGEIIDDRMEEGLDEAAAVEAMGDIDQIVSGILADTPLTKLVKAKLAPRRSFAGWEIILLILGSPVWLPLLAAAVLVVLSVYLVLWTVVAVIYVAMISFAVGAVTGVLGGLALTVCGSPARGVLNLGLGLICAGLTILTFYGGNRAAKAMAALSRNILLGIKRCFMGKESAR